MNTHVSEPRAILSGSYGLTEIRAAVCVEIVENAQSVCCSCRGDWHSIMLLLEFGFQGNGEIAAGPALLLFQPRVGALPNCNTLMGTKVLGVHDKFASFGTVALLLREVCTMSLITSPSHMLES